MIDARRRAVQRSARRHLRSGFVARFHDLTYAMCASALAPLFTTHVLTEIWYLPCAVVLVLGYFTDKGRIPRITNRPFWIATTALVVVWVALQVPDSDMRFTAFLRLLLYLQAYRLLNAKRNREYLQVYLLAFFQVLVTTALNPNFSMAPTLLVFMVTSTWALAALTLKRGLEAEASFGSPAPLEPLAIGVPTPADGLVRARYLAATAGIAIGTFAVTFPIFYAIPRIGAGFFLSPLMTSQLISGFNEEVNLGAVGELELSNKLALRVQLDDPQKLKLLGPLRHMRGIALNQYDGKGRWKNTLAKKAIPPRNVNPLATRDFQVGPGPGRRPIIAYTVYQEPIGTSAIFGFPVPFQVLVNAEHLRLDEAGSVLLPRLPGSTIAYTVQSFLKDPDPDELRGAPVHYDADIRQSYLGIYPGIDPRVPDLAREITAGATNPYDKAVAIRDYLERNYTYTLDLARDHRFLPLEDFLFVQKAGHCEYFATAQAILLRAVGVPTRIVNGFLQGEWNPIGGYLIVRESDAHSWVEVFFPAAGWITFDPSPRSIASPETDTTPTANAVHFFDAIRMVWNRYVLAFTAADQRNAFERAMQAYSTTRWLHGPDPVAWLKGGFQGGNQSAAARAVGGIVLALALGIAAWNLLSAPRELRRWRRRKDDDRDAGAALATSFYREMLARLARKGIPKDPAATPREFSGQVRELEHESAAAVARLTALFERVRYAGSRLGEDDWNHAREDLAAVRASRRAKANPASRRARASGRAVSSPGRAPAP